MFFYLSLDLFVPSTAENRKLSVGTHMCPCLILGPLIHNASLYSMRNSYVKIYIKDYI